MSDYKNVAKTQNKKEQIIEDDEMKDENEKYNEKYEAIWSFWKLLNSNSDETSKLLYRSQESMKRTSKNETESISIDSNENERKRRKATRIEATRNEVKNRNASKVTTTKTTTTTTKSTSSETTSPKSNDDSLNNLTSKIEKIKKALNDKNISSLDFKPDFGNKRTLPLVDEPGLILEKNGKQRCTMKGNTFLIYMIPFIKNDSTVNFYDVNKKLFDKENRHSDEEVKKLIDWLLRSRLAGHTPKKEVVLIYKKFWRGRFVSYKSLLKKVPL